jgi:hypothetical protein
MAETQVTPTSDKGDWTSKALWGLVGGIVVMAVIGGMMTFFSSQVSAQSGTPSAGTPSGGTPSGGTPPGQTLPSSTTGTIPQIQIVDIQTGYVVTSLVRGKSYDVTFYVQSAVPNTPMVPGAIVIHCSVMAGADQLVKYSTPINDPYTVAWATLEFTVPANEAATSGVASATLTDPSGQTIMDTESLNFAIVND